MLRGGPAGERVGTGAAADLPTWGWPVGDGRLDGGERPGKRGVRRPVVVLRCVVDGLLLEARLHAERRSSQQQACPRVALPS